MTMTMNAASIAIAAATNPCCSVARAIASRCRFGCRRSFVSSTSSCHQHQNTSSNSNSPQNPSRNTVQVPPPPSWSVNELRLTSTHDDKISNEELATLARRCLIDVRRLSPERRDELRVHVAGIVRCASVLLDSRNLDMNDDVGADGNNLSDEDVYDVPRSLTKTPIRRDGNLEKDEQVDCWAYDSTESKAVMQSEGVQSKMVQSDDGSDEKFFSVITKR